MTNPDENERREKLAVDRRLDELRTLDGFQLVKRLPRSALVRVGGACVLLDGRRLARDPSHRGLRLLGGDLELRAERANG